MPSSKQSPTAGVSIQVSVILQQSQAGEKPPQSIAHAFTDTGHFVTKAAMDNNGSVTLTVPSVSSARNVRIVVGPELKGGEAARVVGSLTRRGRHIRRAVCASPIRQAGLDPGPAPAADLLTLQVIAQTADSAALRQALIANVEYIRFWIGDS